MEKKYLKKIRQYELLSAIPFYKKNALKKIQKYKDRLAKSKNDLNEYEYISEMISTEIDLQNSQLNTKHKDYGKKKILVIGSLRYKNRLSLYSNCILKSLNYEKIVLHFYDYDTKKLIRVQSEAYEQNEDYKDVLYTAELNKINASLYDISIQILDSELPFAVPHKSAKISYAYLPNFSFTDLQNEININFDAVLYPERNMDKRLYNEEILLPKFYLPFSIDLNLYERFEFKTNNFRIGFLADILTIRKYFNKLLPLNNYFKKNNIVVEFTYLPSELNFQRTPVEKENLLVKELSKKATENLIFNKGFIYLLPPEVYEKNKNWDLFVYAEENENYMYNPLQTLRAGKCALFPTGYKISSDISVEGCFKYSDEGEIIEYIKEFIENKDNLFTSENVSKRKSAAEGYSIAKNADLYNEIIYPGELILGESNQIYDNGIQFREKNLYTKYNYYENRENYNTEGKLIPVPCHDAGFGSILNKYVSMLVYAKDDEVYIPDWRVLNIAKNRFKVFKDKKFWSFCYGKAEDENVFLKIFDLPYTEGTVPTVLYHSDLMYEKSIKQSYFTEYNIEREPNLAHCSTGLYSSDYFKEFRMKYNEAYKKHIKIKPEIIENVEAFCSQYFKTLNIGVHIRCAAHPDESIDNIKRTDFNRHFQLYDNKIAEILKENDIDINSDKWCLYIATDNDIALDYFKTKYGKNACYREDTERLTKQQEMEYENDKISKGRYLIGYELQQRRCLTDKTRSTALAFDILKDMLILSKSDYFIYQNSNVPLAVSYMNPDLKMVYAK